MSEKRCCGNCGWWDVEQLWQCMEGTAAPCSIPRPVIPASYELIRLNAADMKADWGINCPCWKPLEAKR